MNKRFAEAAMRLGHKLDRDFVLRDHGEGNGIELEWLAGGSPPSETVINGALQEIDGEKSRLDSFKTDADYQDLATRLSAATPAQVKTYVQNNVTDLASARVLLTKILLLLGRLYKGD